MTTFGLTDAGFVPMTFDNIRQDLILALQAAFGASIDLGNKSIFGQLTAIIAERMALLWEMAEAVNSSQDPDKATGAGLDALCVLTGTFRPPASYSTVTLTLTGTPTAVVTAGKHVATASTAKAFATIASGTITALNAWVTLTPYIVGNRVTANARCYQCITAGTSGALAPSTTLADITDGTAHWAYLGEGTGAIDVAAMATVTGPITAAARDITEIQDAVAGWSSVINVLDAAPGSNVATDATLRTLRDLELSSAGRSTIDAIIAALSNITDVASVKLFVNNTDLTDAAGVPPHAIEALVRRVGDTYNATFDQAVWDALLANVAAGIVTAGLQTGTSTDSQGVTHTMKYTRPTAVPIYIAVTLVKDPALYPTDGDAQVKQAIVDWGNLQPIGKDAVASAITAQVFKVIGVLDVTTCFIDDVPAPATSATVAIDLRHLATYDTSRITVTTSNGTP